MKDFGILIVVIIGFILLLVTQGTSIFQPPGMPALSTASFEPVSEAGTQTSRPVPTTPKEIQAEIHRVRAELDTVEAAIVRIEAERDRSSYYDIAVLERANARSSTPRTEYLRIRIGATATSAIPITGWVLRSLISQQSARIGHGNYLPFTGSDAPRTVFLEPGGSALITTGRSPNGQSFRLNRCTGYFEQFQDFSPHCHANVRC